MPDHWELLHRNEVVVSTALTEWFERVQEYMPTREGAGTCSARYLNAPRLETFVVEKVLDLSSLVDCSWGFPQAQSEREKSEEPLAKLTAARRGTPSGGDLVGPDSVYYVGLPFGQGVVGFGKLG